MGVAEREIVCKHCAPTRVKRILCAGEQIHLLALIAEEQTHSIPEVPIYTVDGLVRGVVVRGQGGKVESDARQRGGRIVLPQLLYDRAESRRGNDVVWK